MVDKESKPLQATFNVDDEEYETVEGIGFEPETKYRFTIEKAPTGKYMQYGAAKGGLYVLSKKCPEDLRNQYQKHPDQFEIFSYGDINGQQGLIPGKDFEKFAPFMSKIIDVAFVHTTDSGAKRLIFMSLPAGAPSIDKTGKHPEWEGIAARVSRKFGYEPPLPGTKEKFNFSWLHPGISFDAEVVMVKQKNSDKERPQIDIETIELVDALGEPAKPQKTLVDDIDPEIRAVITEFAEGEKSVVAVIKKVKKYLADQKITDPKVLGDYSAAVTRMKDRKEILA